MIIYANLINNNIGLTTGIHWFYPLFICVDILKDRQSPLLLPRICVSLPRIRLKVRESSSYRRESCDRFSRVYMRVQIQPRPLQPFAMGFLIYPLIVTLLWCLNTILYLWSRFIYYFVLLCNIIYIQSKSYVNVYITLKEILLISHEIMFITVYWHLIGYINIAMICHLPHA